LRARFLWCPGRGHLPLASVIAVRSVAGADAWHRPGHKATQVLGGGEACAALLLLLLHKMMTHRHQDGGGPTSSSRSSGQGTSTQAARSSRRDDDVISLERDARGAVRRGAARGVRRASGGGH
jgi:hypothetical protein